MKRIGIIGGLSPESTISYYQYLNQLTKEHFGGLAAPEICIRSVNQQVYFDLKAKDDWASCGTLLGDAARDLEQAGSEIIILATNTMHHVAHDIENAISIPFIHIADAAAQEIKQQNIHKIGLLGTKYTMDMPFYKGRLKDKHQIDTVVPNEASAKIINDIIFDELCFGKITEESRQKYIAICQELVADGAQAILLGCTEIGLLIKSDDLSCPVLDTAEIHAKIAFETAISNDIS